LYNELTTSGKITKKQLYHGYFFNDRIISDGKEIPDFYGDTITLLAQCYEAIKNERDYAKPLLDFAQKHGRQGVMLPQYDMEGKLNGFAYVARAEFAERPALKGEGGPNTVKTMAAIFNQTLIQPLIKTNAFSATSGPNMRIASNINWHLHGVLPSDNDQTRVSIEAKPKTPKYAMQSMGDNQMYWSSGILPINRATMSLKHR